MNLTMKRYRVRLDTGEDRIVEATNWGARANSTLHNNDKGERPFTAFVIEREQQEVFVVQTRSIISVEEVGADE